MTESKEAPVAQVEDVKRWTAKRKSAVVLDLIKGKTTERPPIPRAVTTGHAAASAPPSVPAVGNAPLPRADSVQPPLAGVDVALGAGDHFVIWVRRLLRRRRRQSPARTRFPLNVDVGALLAHGVPARRGSAWPWGASTSSKAR